MQLDEIEAGAPSASGRDMPARTADTRLSTASGQTSASSRCRRRARALTTATGGALVVRPGDPVDVLPALAARRG